MDRTDDDDDSLHALDLWENQGQTLTASALRAILATLPDDLPVELEHYDATGDIVKLRPMHIDLRGFDQKPEAVVLVGH